MCYTKCLYYVWVFGIPYSGSFKVVNVKTTERLLKNHCHRLLIPSCAALDCIKSSAYGLLQPIVQTQDLFVYIEHLKDPQHPYVYHRTTTMGAKTTEIIRS